MMRLDRRSNRCRNGARPFALGGRGGRAARVAAVALLIGCAAGPPVASPADDPASDPASGAPVGAYGGEMRIVGYYAGFTAPRGFTPADIPAGWLTHVNYAFAAIAPDGTLAYRDRCIDVGECEAGKAPVPGWTGAFDGLRALKRAHPHLRVLVSVGGWGGSGRFSDVALNDSTRRRFVRSAIARFLDDQPGVFDGFDLDWEYPVEGGLPENARRPEDRENFTRLLAEFRRQLDARQERAGADGRATASSPGARYLLTIATASSERHLANLEVARILELVDWINVMTYDYHTGGGRAHFNAPLYAGPGDPTPGTSIDATVTAYLRAGVPPDRLVLGVPFFGRGYGGVEGGEAGLYRPAGGAPDGTWGVGGIRYRELLDAERRGFERHWEPVARVPWLYSPETGVWISYDDPRSIAAKADYALARGLGGVMIWELSADDGVLLDVIRRRLARPDPAPSPVRLLLPPGRDAGRARGPGHGDGEGTRRR